MTLEGIFGKKNKGVFIVAEISANHGQDFNRAVSLIKAAKRCGADAVKFQAYTPDSITMDSANKYFIVKHPRWGGQTLYQLYRKAYTPWSWFRRLKAAAEDAGLVFFATAFDRSSVDFLEELKVGVHKIASFELVDLPLVDYAARTKKALILSTGMATMKEIREAAGVARSAGNRRLVLLKCLSSYPARPDEMNLMTIPDMARRFRCPIGLSDHSLNTTIDLCAAAVGARVIERHFTLSRRRRTPDSFFSAEPAEFREMVRNIRLIEEALGKVSYGPSPAEKPSRVFRRSLFAVKDIRAGETFDEENIRSIRPAGGLEPKYLNRVVGRRARTGLKAGTPLSWKAIA